MAKKADEKGVSEKDLNLTQECISDLYWYSLADGQYKKHYLLNNPWLRHLDYCNCDKCKISKRFQLKTLTQNQLKELVFAIVNAEKEKSKIKESKDIVYGDIGQAVKWLKDGKIVSRKEYKNPQQKTSLYLSSNWLRVMVERKWFGFFDEAWNPTSSDLLANDYYVIEN